MAILLDSRGNEFQGALDAINGLTLTDARTSTNNLAAANSEVVVDINGKATVTFFVQCVVTMAANDLVIEGTIDGTNFFAIPYYIQASTIPTHVAESIGVSISPTAMAAGQFIVVTATATGWRRIRMRKVSATGNANVSLRASVADYRIIVQPQPALLNVSLAPAVNVGGTITLPAAGAGLFHYVTAIQATLAMNPATAQVGAASVFVTTTNLPGTPAWAVPVCGNAAASTGGLGAAFASVIGSSFPNPLKSSVANTATTVVFPIPGAACTWRANVQYFVGA
jgi:hypothetical protein